MIDLKVSGITPANYVKNNGRGGSKQNRRGKNNQNDREQAKQTFEKILEQAKKELDIKI